jgi:hypothetical protein
MASVGIHPPKTPVTKGSMGTAKATLPNVCKMPGPPAPFVPSPLPNIATSGTSPKGYSKRVKVERKTVAIRGASFKSMGDIASKGTGGGLLSMNTHGPAKFIMPGSFTVKFEGKGVHLLGEPMLNNLGASGSPPNTGATLTGVSQETLDYYTDLLTPVAQQCSNTVNAQWDKDHPNGPKHTDCATELPGETMGDGSPKRVRVKLGELKEACVNAKMGKDPEGLRSQEAFLANGRAVGKGKPFGAVIPNKGGGIPDFCIVSEPLRTSSDVMAIFELKFGCGPGNPKGNLSDTQRLNWPRLFQCPIVIIP